jgi:hypothetical protein
VGQSVGQQDQVCLSHEPTSIAMRKTSKMPSCTYYQTITTIVQSNIKDPSLPGPHFVDDYVQNYRILSYGCESMTGLCPRATEPFRSRTGESRITLGPEEYEVVAVYGDVGMLSSCSNTGG